MSTRDNTKIEAGQRWRRHSDGGVFTVLEVDPEQIHNRRVTIKRTRRTRKLVMDFRLQYAFTGLTVDADRG